ncbi:MAG TPA: hypothetical protein VK642_13945 [Burkholderiales bacterium]|jgi:hypothetical protein|nr:hypothetical protein [Burkholderiales bacterium]
MKNLMAVTSLLLLSVAFVTPADANWFSSQKHNTMFNIGSVRNPTPQELRFYYAKAEAERQAKAARKQ